MNDDVAVRPQTEIEQTVQVKLVDVLSRYKKSIDAMLPKMIDPKRFAWLAVTAVRSNPRLAECSPASFINSVMLATQMGLEIRRDSAYLIPFGKECQLLIDYKGKMGLARRSGKVGGIQAVSVRAGDDFDWHYDKTGVVFNHRPFGERNGTVKITSEEERGALVGFYAFAELTNGGTQFREPMSLAEIDRIRRRSRAGVPSMSLQDIFDAHAMTEDGKQAIWQSWQFRDPRRQPWVTDFEAMAIKTVLHSLFKSLPLDPEAQRSQEVDEGYETGKQPNILADIVDIEPQDTMPMIETTDKEGVKIVAARRIQEERAKSASTEPSQPTPPKHVQDIVATKDVIGEQAWERILANNSYAASEVGTVSKNHSIAILLEMSTEMVEQEKERHAVQV